MSSFSDMALNQWDNRSKTSGFYNIIDDEMIGRQSLDRIRRYGTFWHTEINDTEELIRLYFYERRALQESGRSLIKLTDCFKKLIDNDFTKDLPAPMIQQNFAEDDGTIRDQVIIWDLSDPHHALKLYDSFVCVKLTRVHHILQYEATNTAKFDYHALLEQF